MYMSTYCIPRLGDASGSAVENVAKSILISALPSVEQSKTFAKPSNRARNPLSTNVFHVSETNEG